MTLLKWLFAAIVAVVVFAITWGALVAGLIIVVLLLLT